MRAAAPVIEAEADTGIPGQGKLLILAVDMTGDRSLRDYDFDNAEQDVIDDPLIFLAQPDSLILTREFADRNHIAIGGKIAFDTMEGRKQFTVRGILKAGGMAQAFGGNLGIMDIYAAQKRVRPRPPLRPHRYRPRRMASRSIRARPRSARCSAPASPSSRPRAAAGSSNRCSASTPSR